MEIHVNIWGWKGIGIIWGHVGHVMISDTENQNSILSQYPHQYKGRSVPKGPNIKLSYPDTYESEGSKPDVIYKLTLPDNQVEKFQDKVKDHLDRKIWDWDPTSPKETHCARSAYEAMKAGGIPIDPKDKYKILDHHTNEILPNSVWSLLEKAGFKPWVQNRENLIQKIIEDNEKAVSLIRKHNLWI